MGRAARAVGLRRAGPHPVGPYGDVHYPAWLRRRLRQRRALYPALPAARQPAIDLLTLVFNTDPAVLRATAASVRRQRYRRFRWVVWDNGSTAPATLAALRALARLPRVTVHRAERNLGITAGHAAALRLCAGDYVAFLDHDDLLSEDALAVAAWFIDRHGGPGLLYSDEDKIDLADRPHWPFFKPDWSPSFLLSTGYTCHLTLARRDLVVRLAAFSDPRVEGSQDWDLALRFQDAGASLVHMAEVLYSWRIWPASTAGAGAAAKPYVREGQRAALQASLARRGLAGRYRVVPNPLFRGLEGHWLLESTGGDVAPVAVVRMASGDERSLAERLRRAAEGPEPFVACVPPGVEQLPADWLRPALTTFGLDPRAALVGGRLVGPDGRLVCGPPVLGLGGVVGAPGAGGSAHDIGYFGLALEPHDVAAVSAHVPWVVRREALRQAPCDTGLPAAWCVPDLCLRLRGAGWRVVYNPHVTAVGRKTFREPEDARPFWQRHGSWLRRDPAYSPHFALDPARAYHCADPAE
jgi:hypothetical protein